MVREKSKTSVKCGERDEREKCGGRDKKCGESD